MSDDRKPSECEPDCGACFVQAHEDHDLGMRHSGAGLVSASCHDCGVSWHRTFGEAASGTTGEDR